jgi:polysaccharide biosynthesis transport protein
MANDYSVESFQAYEFLDHVKRRWKFILAVCGGAATIALVVSLLLPNEYTATATIVIDPPAGNDPRMSITISPVYLESLRAYELFATSDTLFQSAIDKFRLRDAESSKSMESLKRSTLKVSKVKDTKILQISATLADPKQAQALAQFLAEGTVNLSRSTSMATDQDLLDEARVRAGDAQKRLEDEQAAWREFSMQQPYESLRADVDALSGSRARVQLDLADSRAELAEGPGQKFPDQLAQVRARVENLEKQDAELERKIEAKAVRLSNYEARSDQFKQKIKAAQASFDAAALRLREIETSAGLHTERLRVMDPGVAPERPSFPNVPLNVLLAMAVALIASITYLALTFRPAR